MAVNDIALTTKQIAPVFPMKAEIYPQIAAEALEQGDAVYINTSGKVAKADANATGPNKFRGIALQKVGAGQAVDVLMKGHVYGYTISGLAYDTPVYVSDTAGALADAASAAGTSLLVARVVPLSDPDRTKVLYFDGFVG